MSMKGKTHPEEIRLKIKQGIKKEITRRKSLGIEHWHKGWNPSYQTREKMSKSQKKRCLKPGYINPSSLPEIRKKISDNQKGKEVSIQTRKNMSLSAIQRCQRPGYVNPSCYSSVKEKRRILQLQKILLGTHNFQTLKSKRGISGYFFSEKEGQFLYYRSLSLEKAWYEIFEKDPNVFHYRPEPCRIPYLWKGKIKKYKPDLKVRYTKNRLELIEFKPEEEWNLPINIAKWNAAIEWCSNQEQSITFRVFGYDELAEREFDAFKRSCVLL